MTETRPVEGFDAVAIAGVGRLTMERGATESLTITAEDNIVPLLRSEVVGGTLELGPRPGTALSPTREILYRLTYREMQTVASSGVTTIQASGIDTPAFTVNTSGTSTLLVSGSADRQRILASGTSSYSAGDLLTRITTLDVSGTATLVVAVSERLEGNVSGAAVVEYIGSPTVDVAVSGAAVVRPH